MLSVSEAIRTRTSIRTYDDRPLSADDRAELEEFLSHVETPFDVPVTFRLFDAAAHGLKSPVIVGAHAYVAAKVPRAPGMEVACGYAFESFCLYAAQRGMGSVMLASSLNRSAFEQALEVGPDEVMPVGSPVGYPAAKRSIRELAMRKAIHADDRLPFGELFFAGSFDTPLSPMEDEAAAMPGVDAADLATLLPLLKLVRLAPSAVNKQPWRVVVRGGDVHFYEQRSMKDNPLGDIQKVDMGIALAHFDLARKEAGVAGAFATSDPGIATPDGVEYITTFSLAR